MKIETIEQVKAEAKKHLGVEITDEQADTWLKTHPDGKLTDDELDSVTGGEYDWERLGAFYDYYEYWFPISKCTSCGTPYERGKFTFNKRYFTNDPIGHCHWKCLTCDTTYSQAIKPGRQKTYFN